MNIEKIVSESKSSLYKKYKNKHDFFHERNSSFEFFCIFAFITFVFLSILILCVFNTPSANKEDFIVIFIADILLFLYLIKGAIYYILEKKYEKLFEEYSN